MEPARKVRKASTVACQVLQWFEDVVSPWWEDLLERWPTHAGATAGGPILPRWQASPTHCRSQERTPNASGPSKNNPRHERLGVAGGRALSLVAILATLGAPIAMFDGVSPNSLAPVRNDPQNRPFQKARRFATRWVRSPAPSGVPASASPCPGCRPRHRRGCRGLNPTRTPTSSTV